MTCTSAAESIVGCYQYSELYAYRVKWWILVCKLACKLLTQELSVSIPYL